MNRLIAERSIARGSNSAGCLYNNYKMQSDRANINIILMFVKIMLTFRSGGYIMILFILEELLWL